MQPDPSRPENAAVLTELEKHASKPVPKSAFVLDDYALRSHPDLEERLHQIAAELRVDCRSSAFGKPTLTAPNGVIFAVAGSMFDFALRLPPEQHDAARASGAQAETPYGPDWWRFPAFSQTPESRESLLLELRTWCARAFEHATRGPA